MEVKAIAKYIKVQPRKVRIIADQVRGKSAAQTVALLRYHTSKSAKELRKTLISAMANAQENHGLSPETLGIAGIKVDEGPRQKRMRARAQGRGNRILKKTSHITVTLEPVEQVKTVKPHGTKAKPRPTLAAPAKKGKKDAKAAKPVAEEVVEAPVVEETHVEAEAHTRATAKHHEAEPAEAAVEEPIAAVEEAKADEPTDDKSDEKKGAK